MILIKPIKGFEGDYLISSDGKVYSRRRERAKGGAMKLPIDNVGYPVVCLFKNKKSFRKRVHNLIAENFMENPTNLPNINHIDCNKTNNKVSNLEWCTYSHNIQHAYIAGLKKTKLTRNQVLDIRKSLSLGERIIDIARRYNVTSNTIIPIRDGRTWSWL